MHANCISRNQAESWLKFYLLWAIVELCRASTRGLVALLISALCPRSRFLYIYVYSSCYASTASLSFCAVSANVHTSAFAVTMHAAVTYDNCFVVTRTSLGETNICRQMLTHLHAFVCIDMFYAIVYMHTCVHKDMCTYTHSIHVYMYVYLILIH